ncbi:MAG: aspartate--ammonia ligase [Phycisphaerales bacterium]|nr:MAG: aspartate--ammonia ligase [Phycisphaerales bacterium]
MPELILNGEYKSKLGLRETERAIKYIKDFFQDNLASALNLQRVSAPLFLKKGSGINDDLNGVEAKATFRIKDDGNREAECLFSLAKWKRMVLADYGFEEGEGLYTDMNAIRPDEECLDNLHSIYVDQWDWERIVRAEERNLEFLKEIVRRIYGVLRQTEAAVDARYPEIPPMLPDDITFVHSEDLLGMYPDFGPREREDRICERYGAVFVIGIGGELADGTMHDSRAPDYDDWITATWGGRRGLNGDILLWYPLLKRAFEISSMGIRVDGESMLKQLRLRNGLERKELAWHKRLLAGELPLSIGGGIGQSRLCMFFLRKLHIGEVQASVWPDEMVADCRGAGVMLL